MMEHVLGLRKHGVQAVMPRRPGEKRRSSSGGSGLSPTSSVGSELGAPNLSTSPTSNAATSSHSGSGETSSVPGSRAVPSSRNP